MDKIDKAKYGELIIREHLDSGKNGRRYCKENNISYESLKYWKRKLGYSKNNHKDPESHENQWIKLETEKIQSSLEVISKPESVRAVLKENKEIAITIRILEVTVEIPSGSLQKDIEKVLCAVRNLW